MSGEADDSRLHSKAIRRGPGEQIKLDGMFDATGRPVRVEIEFVDYERGKGTICVRAPLAVRIVKVETLTEGQAL